MNLNILNPEKLFFTSDTHFFHKHAVEYNNRPFDRFYDLSPLEVMNYELIENWNCVVPKDGIVFHLGDFAFTGSIDKIKYLLGKLNGSIYLLKGNHDIRNRYERDSVTSLFAGVYDILDIKVNDDELEEGFQYINLCHYPIESWSKKQSGAWHLHGHIHSGKNSSAEDRNISTIKNRYDVGVDNNNYYPISYYGVKEIINK